MPVVEGDPFGPIKDPTDTREKVSAKQINEAHRASDLDSGANAQHHTLGPKANQASPGDHIHDGRTSKRIGTGMNITVQTSSGTADQKIDRLILALQKVMDVTTT